MVEADRRGYCFPSFCLWIRDRSKVRGSNSFTKEALDLCNAVHSSPGEPLAACNVGGGPFSPKRCDGLTWPQDSQQVEKWAEGDLHSTENAIERNGVPHQSSSYTHIQLQPSGLQSLSHKNADQPDSELGFRRGSLATVETSSSLCASQYHLQQEYDRGDANGQAQVGAGSELPPRFHPSVTASRGALERIVGVENSALDRFMSEEQESLAAGFLLDANAGDQPPEIQERLRGGASRIKEAAMRMARACDPQEIAEAEAIFAKCSEVGVNKQCQHCGRTFGREEALEKHEGVCQRMFKNGGGLRKGGGLCAAQGAACRVQGQLALKEKEHKAREQALSKRNSKTPAWQRQRYHSSHLPGAPLSRQTAEGSLRQRLGGGAPHTPHAALPGPIRTPMGDLCPPGQ
ncbi:hypothetical protein Emag_003215 [Eimeria magna]